MKKLLTAALLFFIATSTQAQTIKPGQLAQEQLDAYNKRDIEAFLKPYADSVKVYLYPGTFLYSGKETMRKQYAEMFEQLKDLHCTLKSRIVLGDKVIDEESVIFDKTKPAMHAVAIYTIAGDKITEVRFIE